MPAGCTPGGSESSIRTYPGWTGGRKDGSRPSRRTDRLAQIGHGRMWGARAGSAWQMPGIPRSKTPAQPGGRLTRLHLSRRGAIRARRNRRWSLEESPCPEGNGTNRSRRRKSGIPGKGIAGRIRCEMSGLQNREQSSYKQKGHCRKAEYHERQLKII
jgi:hypothetical protein